MDRRNTCVSLFSGFNEIENYINKYRENVISLNSLETSDKIDYFINGTKTVFSEQEKQAAWYKIIEERRQITPSNDKIIKMIISLCALIIGLNKEEILNKNNGNLDILVKENSFEITILRWLKNKEGKLYFGEIEFENTANYLNFIRNKLLHGDYYIKGQFIILKDSDKIGRMHFNTLLLNCLDLSWLPKCHGKTIEKNMVLYQKNEKSRKENRIFIDEIYDVKIKVQVKGKREISLDIIRLLSEIESYIFEYNINQKMSITQSIELALKKYESEISSNHINIDFELSSFVEKENDNVSNKFEEMISFFNEFYNIDMPTFDDMFQFFNLNNFNNSKDYFNDKFIALADFLRGSLKKSPGSKLKPNAFDSIRYRKISSALDILKFYCYFNYGLDNILFSSEELTLKALFNEKFFDYSKLDLSLFDDPNMKCDVKFGSYQEQLFGITNEYEKSKVAYLSKKSSYDNFIKKYGHTKPDVEKRIKEPLDYLEKCYKESKKYYDMSREFDINKYTRNLNIIYHIRNSIAHGNYEIDNSDINDIRYIFKDIYNDELTYSLNISVNDFRKLFNYRDILNIFYDGIAQNMTSDELREKEIYYDCPYVNEEKESEWNTYVDGVLNNGDESDKRVLSLTYDALIDINFPVGNFYNQKEFIECIEKNINNYLDIAMNNIEKLKQGVIFDNQKYTIEEYEKVIKNILTYDRTICTFIKERKIFGGEENSLLNKVLNDIEYKGILSNYSRGKN